MRKIKLNLSATATADKQSAEPKANSLLSKVISFIKLRVIITCWLFSLMMLFTDNFTQAFIALCFFATSSALMEKNKEEVNKLIENLDRRFDRLINK